jgi:peptidoglycan hydrolase-like protein with peptidoglycan-binding domain
MKQLLSIILFFVIVPLLSYGQLGDAMTHTMNKKKVKNAVESIPEQAGRSFFKSGNNQYLAQDASSDDLVYYDNNIYADAVLDGEHLTVKLFKFIPSSKAYLICPNYHGDDLATAIYTNYIHLDGDVYALSDDNGQLTRKDIFMFYNPSRGLYFHYNIYTTGNGRESGGGYYKRTKSEEISSEELAEESNGFKNQFAIYENALLAYAERQRQVEITRIMATPDEGITSTFQKDHVGKMLFGNQVTDQNKAIAASYKSKFTIDEKISVCFFLDKGLNKYFDKTADFVSENLDSYHASHFKLRMTYDNGASQIQTVAIDHLEGIIRSSGIFNLVVVNDPIENNNWVMNFFPEKIEDKEHPVKLELLTNDDHEEVLALGSFTYAPKKGAKLPIGTKCALPADFSPSMAKYKPRMKEVADFQIARYNKQNGTNYKITDLAVYSGWMTGTDQLDLPFKEAYVKFLCTNGQGASLILFDTYSLPNPADDSLGIFRGMVEQKLNFSPCDAK